MKFNIVNHIYKRWRGYAISSFLSIAIMLPICAFMIIDAPDDYLQESFAKIMYIHVPAAWMSLGIYFTLSVCSIMFVIYRSLQFYMMQRALAPIGLMYCVIALATGSIWGVPTWGTWWVWDARLTSMLLLGFIYLGYLVLISNADRKEGIALIASYYLIIGLINIPIIKFSVNIWSTLHQDASVLRIDGPTIHNSMLIVLLLNAIMHSLIVAIMFVLSLKVLIDRKKILNIASLSA